MDKPHAIIFVTDKERLAFKKEQKTEKGDWAASQIQAQVSRQRNPRQRKEEGSSR